MNKFLKSRTLFSLIIVISFLVVSAYAESEWLIDSIEKLQNWTCNSEMLQYEIKNGKCEFTIMGDEPYISYVVQSGKETDFSKNKIAAFRASCDAEGCSVKIVAENVNGEEFEAICMISGDGEWHDYTVDFSAKGKITAVKVYFLSENYAEENVHIVFDRIGFFGNSDGAKYFLDRSLVSLKRKDEILYPSGNGPFKWNFSETADVKSWEFSADHVQEPGMLKLSPKNGEPVKIGTSFESNYFNSREYRFFAIRYKSSSVYDVARLDFSTTVGIGSEYFVLKNDGAWHNLIVDASKYAGQKWNGYVDNIEILLPFRNVSVNDTVYIERIGFFESYNDASQYLIENADRDDYKEKKVFKGSNYKIIVPEGAMTEAYEEKEISVDFSTEFNSSDIVMLNGNPLPLSDISENGYVVYCAKQKGNYTVGAYEKKYSDTESHWAKDYIDYVSARTLFSGTSPDTFSPDITITRGMFVTVLGRMHGVDAAAVGTDSGYSDVPQEEYYSPYIKWVKENGIFVIEGDKFYPNQPITRSEMAFIIANYTDFCGFELQSYETSNAFYDISECAPEVKKAIEKIQSIGIINGKSITVFDPDGILTRAEASTVMTRLIKSVLGVFYGNSSFENSGIRIGAYANFDTDTLNEPLLYAYLSAGFNSMFLSNEVAGGDKRDFVLGYCDRHGIDAVVPFDYMTSDLSEVSEYCNHPSFCGSFVSDEPGTNEFDILAESSEIYSEKYSGEKFVSNLLPLYASEAQLEYGKLASYPDYYDTSAEKYRIYCEDYASKVKSNVIMTNIFPFIGDGIYERYIEAVSIPADVAKKKGKEFWCIIQADKVHNDKQHFIRQYYMLLSFGCKNIISWLWNDGLCDDYGNYTKSYASVKEANYEIKPVVKALSEYTYSYTSVAGGTFDNELYGIKPVPNEIRANGTEPVVIGVFESGEKKAYVLFNTSQTDYAEIAFELQPKNAGFTVIGEGGETKAEKTNNNTLTLKLGAGEGVMITF